MILQATCKICHKPLTPQQIKRRFTACSERCRREGQSRYMLAMVARQRAGTFEVFNGAGYAEADER